MVIVRILAGLGNQMFQYALARSIAESGKDVLLDVKKPYQDYENELPYEDREYGLEHFQITLKKVDLEKNSQWKFLKRKTRIDNFIFLLSKNGKWPYQHINEENFFGKYNPKLFDLQKDCYLAGTFQNERYFKEIRHILLEEFKLKKSPIISRELKYIIDTKETIGVHIRRGDYVKFKKALGLCSITYYEKAIDYIKQTTCAKNFLFFSNDLEWVKEHFVPQQGDSYFYANEDCTLKDYEELDLMSKCTHNIIANSSFSWWGAWLNKNPKKIVIAPKVWFRNNLSYKIVPNDWITM